MKQLFILRAAFLILVVFFSNSAIAQPDIVKKIPALKGLTRVEMKDLKQQVMLDGESIPIYSKEGKRVKGMEMMQKISSGDFAMVPYVDKDENLKAIVLRPNTPEEKARMLAMMKQMDAGGEVKGKKAIPFKVEDIAGKQYSLAALKGKVVVVNFWFTACKPCLMEMPELNKLVQKYQDKGVVFLAFAMDGKAKLQKFLGKKKFDYKVVGNARNVANDYGINSYPTNMIIDKETNITFSLTGYFPTIYEKLDKAIEKALN